MDDQDTQSEPTVETPVQAPEPAPIPVEPESSQPNGSTPTDLPPEDSELPINASSNIPVEDPNSGLNQPESEVPEPSNDASISKPTQSTSTQSVPSAPTPPTSSAPQPQSSAQSPQASIPAMPQPEPISSESAAFRDIQARGRSKIQTNRQEKIDKLIEFAQKKQIIDNEEIQILLHVSSATATRYLEDLVKEGRLVSEGSPRHAKYKFIR